MFESTGETRLVVMPLLDRSNCRDCRRNGLLRGAVNEKAYWKSKGQVAEKIGSGKEPPVVATGVSAISACNYDEESLCVLTSYGGTNLGELDEERVLEIGNCVLALLNY